MENEDSAIESSEDETENEENPEDNLHNQQKITVILAKMNKCHYRIKQLEDAEVDLDDEQKNSFLKMRTCQKRIINLYNEGCEIERQPGDAGRPLKMRKFIELTGHGSIDAAINAVVNRDWFNIPTFSDVLDCIKVCNFQEDLRMSRSAETSLASQAYTKLVDVLQRLRQEDLYSSYSRIYEETEDPAKSSRILWDRLLSNQRIGIRNLNAVLDDFVQKEHEQLIKKSRGRRPGESQGRSRKPRRSSGERISSDLEDSEEADPSSGDDGTSERSLSSGQSLGDDGGNLRSGLSSGVFNDSTSGHSAELSEEEASGDSTEEVAGVLEESAASSETSEDSDREQLQRRILDESTDRQSGEFEDATEGRDEDHSDMGDSAPNFAVSTLNERNFGGGMERFGSGSGCKKFSGSERMQGFSGSERIQGLSGSERIQGLSGSGRIQGLFGTQGFSGSEITQDLSGSERMKDFSGNERIQDFPGSEIMKDFSGNERMQDFSGSQRTQGLSGSEDWRSSDLRNHEDIEESEDGVGDWKNGSRSRCSLM